MAPATTIVFLGFEFDTGRTFVRLGFSEASRSDLHLHGELEWMPSSLLLDVSGSWAVELLLIIFAFVVLGDRLCRMLN